MTETSGFWTTEAVTPAGHQVASYTQAIAARAWAILAACGGFQGVANSWRNELVGSVPGANTARIGTGGGVVDGQWYDNDAAVDVTIPSAVGGGNTRIDRIVLRVTWANFECVITRIAGTDAASPAAPAITQTPGTVYDIMLYQALVNTAGAVSLTDERVWAAPSGDGTTIEQSAGELRVKDLGISTAKLAANAVDNTKLRDSAALSVIGRASNSSGDPADIAAGSDGHILRRSGTSLGFGQIVAAGIAAGAVGNTQLASDAVDDAKAGYRVAKVTKRQGSSSTNWGDSGGSNYTPTDVKIQAGAAGQSTPGASSGTISITYPEAFDYVPLVFVMNRGSQFMDIRVQSTTANGFEIVWDAGTTPTSNYMYWIAIGPG